MSDMIFWSPGVKLDDIERQVILKALAHFKNNRTATANALGISSRGLYDKLERYEYEDKQRKEREMREAEDRKNQLARARGNPPNNLGIPYSPNLVTPPPVQASVVQAAAPVMNDRKKK